MESHKAPDNAVKAFKRPAYQEYSVLKTMLENAEDDLSGKIMDKAEAQEAWQ